MERSLEPLCSEHLRGNPAGLPRNPRGRQLSRHPGDDTGGQPEVVAAETEWSEGTPHSGTSFRGSEGKARSADAGLDESLRAWVSKALLFLTLPAGWMVVQFFKMVVGHHLERAGWRSLI